MSNQGTAPQQKMEIKLRANTKVSNLERVRVKRDMTQRQLAEKSGVPIYTIQGFERLARNINGTGIENLLSLCLALDCQIEDIIEGEGTIDKARKVRAVAPLDLSSSEMVYAYPENLVCDVFEDKEAARSCIDSEVTLEYLYGLMQPSWGDILKLRYKDKQTLAQIGERYQFSVTRAGQIIEAALKKLREDQNLDCLRMGIRAYKEHREREEFQISLQKANRRLSEVSIEELNLSGRAYNCLMKAGYDTIGKVAELDIDTIRGLKNMGETAAHEVFAKIKAYAEKRNAAMLADTDSILESFSEDYKKMAE